MLNAPINIAEMEADMHNNIEEMKSIWVINKDSGNNEKIQIVKAGNVLLTELPQEIPSDHARYHVYFFKHYHEGDYLESYIFIYSMPGYSCSVRERMMYPSCKAPLLDALQSYGIIIAKKLEISEGSELTEEFLQDELHPKQILHKPQFAKPKGPPNRGAKRVTKSQQ